MSASRDLLIVNRKSREGDTDLGAALASLRATGVELIEVYPEHPGEAVDLIREHRGRIDRVLIGGGDGTISATAPALLGTGLPLGILPLGTANDLARTLGIPTELPAACDVIAHGERHRIDLGRVNGVYFFNVAHIGFAVKVTHHLSHETKRRWGVIGYAHGAWRALRANRSFRVEVLGEGRRTRLRSIQISVGNGRHYGGGLTIAEDARIDDHRLDLYSIAPQTVWSLLRLAPALRRGTHGRREDVLLMRGRAFEVRTRRRMPVATDGELTTHTPANFDLLPDAIEVFVPRRQNSGEEGSRHAAG